MPWDDWQFYVVTAAACWGAWMLLRQLLPAGAPSPACGACATGAAACARKPRTEPKRIPGALVVLEERRPPAP